MLCSLGKHWQQEANAQTHALRQLTSKLSDREEEIMHEGGVQEDETHLKASLLNAKCLSV